VGVERAEPPGEGGVLVLVDELVAEEDDLVLEDGGLDLVARGVGDLVSQVHPADLGADGGLEWADGDRVVVGFPLGDDGHGTSPTK